MAESDFSKLFTAMTLEDDASVKLEKVEETPSMMFEDTLITMKKGEQEPSMTVPQVSWKNFIGVCDRSVWINVDKRPSRTGADRRPSRTGVDRRASRVGVDKRPSRIGVDKRPSRIGVHKRPSRIGVDKRPSRIGVDKRPAGIGVQRRPMRILDECFWAVIRYPPTVTAERRYGYDRVRLGSYRSPEEAALAYDREAYRFYGSQAKLNFPHLILPTSSENN